MNKNVLIIEDDAITGHIYKTRLEKANYRVEVVNDGQAGFYRIHESDPDAVLLDMMLPNMNGLDVLKRIRAQSRFAKTAILVFTNAYVPNMVNEAMAAGANQVFNKSTLTPRQLLDALRAVLEPGLPAAAPAPEKAPAQESSVAHAGGRIPQPATGTPGDAEAEADVLHHFLNSAPGKLTTLRKLHMDFSKATGEPERAEHLLKMYGHVHAITGGAGLAGLYDLSQMSAALEVLLKELHEKPKSINPSTSRTVAHAIDFLTHLLRYDTQSDLLTVPTNILVVDDEVLSRRAITFALDKAQLKSESVEDPNRALELATTNHYDLIFLDVQMPGMDGYELCTKIRAGSHNGSTPVIFVTSMTDFQSRARSSHSGGNDFIAKPFLFIELSVKALIQILQRRLSKN